MINNNKDKNIKFNVKEDEEFKIRLVADGKAAPIIIDNKGKDYKGLKLVADSFAEDVNLVSGIKCDVVTDINNLKYMIIDTPVIIAGSIGNNEVIDLLIKNKVIDVSEIKGKRECYKIEVVDKPIENIKRAVVVIGSDKRGSIYGIYNISELMGVSPWVYFADVMPKKRDEIIFDKSELNKTSKEPSVKYRGFFLNDEWPSLGSWVTNTFGDFNELFYDKVFQLILRLKGNFMWPAMWSAVFSENGKSNPLANAELANDYGIVMGTSHHESMFRAGEEWKNICNTYGDNKAWDFRSNSDAISKFWEDGLKRNKNFESLITVGMRGEQDSALEGTQEENIELLKKIILTQKEMLKNQGLGNAPQVLTIYKEVEKYWYGTNDTNGLRNWDVLNDVTIMLADDNFANVRTLPAPREKDRKAGWGMYYHFDYHGGPISYEWVNTTPLEKIWEQMTMAYEYGVRDIWIVNVGDLKPMEFPLSYFMDLAYDFDKWGTNGLNKTDEYTKRWVKQQFGDFISDNKDEIINGIADVLEGYTKMSGFRKPEVTYTTTYSYSNYNEAQRVLDMADKLESEAQKYYESASDKYKDSFY
ncbi:glycosyl hydrolase 115 family protein [Clostridium sp. SM-530-WT-3G]|uniref:glycosyl hydrolase 115 family protein n=1 Tax=Clostridium sp. SM-530-WT-3G TaxID=2725303 RepID=UPI001FAB9D0B|nr:glycosyl hydrolase 115 family protein [Clostridium sp. SM-530-WT-3G]